MFPSLHLCGSRIYCLTRANVATLTAQYAGGKGCLSFFSSQLKTRQTLKDSREPDQRMSCSSSSIRTLASSQYQRPHKAGEKIWNRRVHSPWMSILARVNLVFPAMFLYFLRIANRWYPAQKAGTRTYTSLQGGGANCTKHNVKTASHEQQEHVCSIPESIIYMTLVDTEDPAK